MLYHWAIKALWEDTLNWTKIDYATNRCFTIKLYPPIINIVLLKLYILLWKIKIVIIDVIYNIYIYILKLYNEK